MHYLGAWSVPAGLAFWLWGIEAKCRSIEEIGEELSKPAHVVVQAERVAQG
jgi:hypothetical protein